MLGLLGTTPLDMFVSVFFLDVFFVWLFITVHSDYYIWFHVNKATDCSQRLVSFYISLLAGLFSLTLNARAWSLFVYVELVANGKSTLLTFTIYTLVCTSYLLFKKEDHGKIYVKLIVLLRGRER